MTGGALDQSALELVSKARTLQPHVAAVALGAGAGSATADLAAYGARTVFVDDDSVYDDYVAEPAAYALAELARAHRPELILFPPTFDSRDVAGRLQAMLGCTLLANADDLLAVDRVRTRVALSVWPGRPGNRAAALAARRSSTWPYRGLIRSLSSPGPRRSMRSRAAGRWRSRRSSFRSRTSSSGPSE